MAPPSPVAAALGSGAIAGTGGTVAAMTSLQTVRAARDEFQLPPSGLELFGTLIDSLGEAVHELLEMCGIRYYDINAHSSEVFVVGWNCWQWIGLPDEAAPRIGAARAALAGLCDFADKATRLAPDRARELGELGEALKRVIEQGDGAPASSIAKVGEYVDAQLAEYRETVRRLSSAFGREERLLVVDTSALLDRPDLQDWKLDGGAWTVVFMPQVHSELDDRKRDTRTRDAAQKVIRQIEDFDRRGDTFAGVRLSGNLTVREVPISPDMSQTLPWLRADVPDDSIVAGALELLWRDLTCRIAIVASDRNVRNKARLAGLGSIHPNKL